MTMVAKMCQVQVVVTVAIIRSLDIYNLQYWSPSTNPSLQPSCLNLLTKDLNVGRKLQVSDKINCTET